MTMGSLLLLAAIALLPACGMAARIRYLLARADAELDAYLGPPAGGRARR